MTERPVNRYEEAVLREWQDGPKAGGEDVQMIMVLVCR